MFFALFSVIACTEVTTTTTTTQATTTTTTTTTATTTTTTVTEEPDVTDPILMGITDVTIYVGDAFDPWDGVSALDNHDGTITADIQLSGDYDITVPGTYTLTYTVFDLAGNSAVDSRTLRVKEALLNTFYIVNGDFSDVLEAPWGHWAGDGGAGSATIVEGVLNYVVTAIGSLTYSNQFSQVDRIVETGKIYQVSFRAKADTGRPMIIQLEDRTTYLKYWSATIDVTTDWVVYEFAFEVTNPSMTTGKLGFFLGAIGTTSVPTTVYLDDVAITELEELPGDHTAPTLSGVGAYTSEIGLPFNPLQGVTVTDDFDLTLTVDDIVIVGTVDINTADVYTLTYTIEDASGNSREYTREVTVSLTPPPSTFVVPNGDFAIDQATSSAEGWLWKTGGNGAAFTAEIVDGNAEIVVTALGDVPHGVQFYLLNRVVEQGRTYRISFDVKALNARPIQVVLENAAYTRQFDYTYNVTTEWQTITFDYYRSNETINTAKFAFFAGLVGTTSVPTTFYIDNITIEAIPTLPDTEAPVITGIDDITIAIGDTFDELFGVGVTDNKDGSLRIVDIAITGLDTLDTSVAGEYTLTYSITDASGNTATETRIVTVAEGIAPTTFTVVNGDFSRDQLVSVTTNGWLWKISGSGAFTAKIQNGIAEINVTNVGIVPHGVQFYQDSRITVTDAVYLITFRAKADMPRPIRVVLENTANWSNIMYADFNLTTEWATYTIEYNNTGAGITTAKFGFFLGAVLGTSVPTTIYLDDVSIVTIAEATDTVAPALIGVDDTILIQGNAFDPLLGVRVWDFNDKLLTAEDIIITGTVDHTTLGSYDLVYTVTDAADHVTQVTRTITVVASGLPSTFTVVNGDFEIPQAISGTDGTLWNWKTSGTGAFTLAIDEGIATVNVTSLGTVPYGVQFFQLSRVIEYGSIYKVTFKAKADIARPIQFAVEGGSSSTNRLYDEIFDISTEWVTYETEVCITNSFSFNNGKFGFYMGLVGTTSVPTTIYLDDVVVELIGYVEDTQEPVLSNVNDVTIDIDQVFNPMTGVLVYDILDRLLAVTAITVTGDQVTLVEGIYVFDSSVAGNYTVTYVVTDKSGNETTIVRNVTVSAGDPVSTFVIQNGDFETPQAISGTDGTLWNWKTSGTGAFTLSIDEGIATIDVTSLGDVPYGVQFFLPSRVLELGSSYLITFRAKADIARPINVVLESSGLPRLFDLNIDITTEWVTYTIECDYTYAASIANGKFGFFLGNVVGTSVPTTIYIDDVTVVEVDSFNDVVAPQILGVQNTIVQLGEAFDPMLGIKVIDDHDRTLLPEYVSVTGTVDVEVAGDYVLTYSVRDSSGNFTTVLRTITVQETLLPSTFTVVNGDFSTDQATPYTQPAINGWGWHGTGTFTASIIDGVAVIDVTALGTVAWGVQFYQQSRVLESGSIYKITFSAKADIARPIQMAIEGGYSTTTRLFDQIFNIETDWNTYTTYVRLPQSASFSNGKFAFFMGLVGTTSVETTIYLDDVIIELVGYVDDTTAPMILGINDVVLTVDQVYDPILGVSVYDSYDRLLTVADVVVTGDQISTVVDAYVFDSSVAGTYTVTYTLIDKYGNESVITRTVTVG